MYISTTIVTEANMATQIEIQLEVDFTLFFFFFFFGFVFSLKSIKHACTQTSQLNNK